MLGVGVGSGLGPAVGAGNGDHEGSPDGAGVGNAEGTNLVRPIEPVSSSQRANSYLRGLGGWVGECRPHMRGDGAMGVVGCAAVRESE